MSDIVVRESIHGTWFYHLGRKDEYKALCGKPSMPTKIPRSAWGHVGHLKERYCAECKRLADEIEAAV